MSRKLKAVVTGATGFIGSHLVAALKKKGYEVIQMPHQSLSDSIGLQQSLQYIRPDYIFHLASYGNMYHQKEEDEIFNANLVKTYNLLQATKNVDYRRFVYVSSSSVTLPHQTMYAATKLGAEALCKAFVDEYNKPIVTVRPYSVYGPGEADFRFIPTVFRSCLTGEKMTLSWGSHDWVYIDDVVRGIIRAAKSKYSDLDLGTGRITRNLDVVHYIENITGKKANKELSNKMRSFDTNNWTEAETYYINFRSLEDGLRKCYEYYKEIYEKR